MVSKVEPLASLQKIYQPYIYLSGPPALLNGSDEGPAQRVRRAGVGIDGV
jgi:hypothetical protein